MQRNHLGGVVLGQKKVFYLAYADNLVLLATKEMQLKDTMRANQQGEIADI